MFSILAALRTLVLPYGVPTTAPQIVINEDPVRPELQTLYASRVISDFIFQKARFDYVYQALVSPLAGRPFLAFGGIESVGLILSEAFRVIPGTFGQNAILSVIGAFQIDGVNQPRGLRSHAASQNPTPAIGAETVVATYPSMTFRSGEAYRVTADAALFGSVANVALYRWRQTNIAGAILQLAQHPCPAGAGAEHRFHDEFILNRTAGSDLTDQVVLTLQASAGTVTQQGTATQVRSFSIYDHGLAADYNAEASI